ncbi:MAG: hypothetical protein VYD19_05010 [Myxococcota bacterium]|nr:hypothetical protein [Myxococcota bacterium]
MLMRLSMRLRCLSLQFSSLLTLFVFAACSEPPTVAQIDESVQDMAFPLDRGRGRTDDQGEAICREDEDCRSGEWCARDEDSASGRCSVGCRGGEADSCEALDRRSRCDLESRTCYRSCEADQGCPDDMWCAREEDAALGRCMLGCRPERPESCPAGERAPQLCDSESRRCLPAVVCCGEPAGEVCSIETEAVCTEAGGEAMLGLLSCQPSPCGALCALDDACAAGEYCSPWGRCAPGCRIDEEEQTCPDDLSCDAETRRCIARICEDDGGCESAQYCDLDLGRCRSGCREDGCGEGQVCDAQRRCSARCQGDDRCEEGYCDPITGGCRAFCEREGHIGCAAGERCDEGRCVLGCADDARELTGDDVRDGSPEVNWEEISATRSRSSERAVLCQGDRDWRQFSLSEGARVELRLNPDEISGSLVLRLYDPAGALIAEGRTLAEPLQLRWPALGAVGAAAGEYALEISGEQVTDGRYTLSLDLRTGEPRCFSDSFDPVDDQPAGARRVGQGPGLRVSEALSGDLCAEDQDWFCFPMSLSDGLDLTLDTPGCEIRGELAEQASFDLSPELFMPYLLEADPAHPGRYQFFGDANASLFSNGEWCLRLESTAGDCEDYLLSSSLVRARPPCSDPREPNNLPAEATPLDGAGPLGGEGGALPEGVDLALNENLEICPGDRDLFLIRPQAGDAFRAWIVDDSDLPGEDLVGRGQLQGELSVSFVDQEGLTIGDRATHNARGAAIEKIAGVLVVNEEPIYLQVSGVDDSAGPYRLFIRREPSDGVCSQDVNEPFGGRDDELEQTTPLREEGGQLRLNNGYLCHPMEEVGDEDWFAFSVGEENTRLCLTTRFRHRDGDVNVELFQAEARGDACQNHVTCRVDDPLTSCVENRCKAPTSHSRSQSDGEMIHFPAGELPPGDYYARVFGSAETENRYALSLTLVPPSDRCDADSYEGTEGNNNFRRPTPLGSGRVSLCDGWLCADERVDGDWYQLTIPAGAQRTVFLRFEQQQGSLLLSAQHQRAAEGGVVDSPRGPGRNVHCLNIRGSASPELVNLQISGDILSPNVQRVDYVLEVSPTNLEANPRGQCDQLSGGLFGQVEWPTLELSPRDR